MTFITTLLKKKIDAEFLFPDTDSLTYEKNQKIFMKSFLDGNICLTLVTFEKIQIFLMRLIKKLLEK